MSTSTTPPEHEHDLLTYVSAKRRMDDIMEAINKETAMNMAIKTPLAKALDAMSCIPFIQTCADTAQVALTIKGVDAGTIYEPKTDVILEKSVPSPFGRGSETVMDPTYRSGREIHANDIKLENHTHRAALYDIATAMFPGRQVKSKLYKLAVYEVGGHFDWHMDSTHSDQHHATLLVALNTSWEGGDLVLRRNGIETAVDLRPQQCQHSFPEEIDLQAVAFFTDTEHRVEPVKSGIRIVLQYDIELEKRPEDEDQTEKNQDENSGDSELDEVGEGGGEEYSEWIENLGGLPYSDRMKMRADVQATTDKANLNKVLAIIKKLHNNGTQEVAFALQHLYRKASISAKYLKGSDATLYDALIASGEFDVSLHPVVLWETSSDDPFEDNHHVYRCDIVDSGPPKKKQRRKDMQEASIAFHIPQLSGIQEISSRDYIEYTGNSAMEGEHRYFAGGMFVRPKDDQK